MGSIVTRMKAVVGVAVGLVLVLGPLQLEAAVGPDSPETPPVQLPTPGTQEPPRAFKTVQFPPIAVHETPREVKIELPGDALFDRRLAHSGV